MTEIIAIIGLSISTIIILVIWFYICKEANINPDKSMPGWIIFVFSIAVFVFGFCTGVLTVI